MSCEYRCAGSNYYRMDYTHPHEVLERPGREIAIVNQALEALHLAGILPGTEYDEQRFYAHREAVRNHFDIPWTAITPRMQRLIYAINAIVKPRVMIAAGIFCGNTFICNAGAAAGPGACYSADRLIGIEWDSEKCRLARKNIRRLGIADRCELVVDDAREYLVYYDGTIDLLFIDTDTSEKQDLYFGILQDVYDKLNEGALILAHNSVNSFSHVHNYLDCVRNGTNFRNSMNVVIDMEGLEVSLK